MIYMQSGSVASWLTNKFLEWQQQSGERKSLTDFAKWLGIQRSILSHYMNGRNKPAGENVDKIAAKLGPEIYDVLGLAREDSISLEKLPPDLQRQLSAAVQEVNSVLSSRGLTGSSPEAEEIVIVIFESYGFKYTRTVKD